MCDIESTSCKPFLHPSACWPQQLLHTYTREMQMDRVIETEEGLLLRITMLVLAKSRLMCCILSE